MEKARNGDNPLHHAFLALDEGMKTALAALKFPLQQGLATLMIAEDRVGMDFLTTQEIADALERAGVAVDPIQVERAFARAGDRIKRKKSNNTPSYKLMIQGRRNVESLLQVGKLQVVFIEGDRPRQGRRKLGEFLGELTGTLRISDPYYGLRTLETLEMIPPETKVLFMTARTNENLARLAAPFAEFRRERPHFDLRRYPDAAALHDRYVLAEDQILFVGHGLKDIGNRESFIISISKTLAPDLLGQVREAFDQKWSESSPL